MYVINQRTNGPVLYRSPECIGYAELEQAWKYMIMCCKSFHPCRSIRKQIWPGHKNGQGQPSVIIWTNFAVLEYPMLYTKFQGHWPLDSEEGDFYRFLAYRAWTPSWSCDPEHSNTFSSHRSSIWNLASNGQVCVFLWKRSLKMLKSERSWPWIVINHHVFIYLTICTPIFTSQASTVSWKSTAKAFSNIKTKGTLL